MASVPGGQYTFFAAGQPVNVVTTSDGTNLPPPILGDFNLELITSPTDPRGMPHGYQGVALESADGRTLDLLRGDYGVRIVDGGPHTIIAGTGNDSIQGGSGPDTIFGGSGHDLISGGSGPDVIYAGTGGDTINAGSGPTTIYGGHGDPHGFDHGHSGDLITGGSGPDVMYGGSGNDTIQGGTGPDTIYAGGGRDLITGGSGPDVIYGGSGNDTIQGGTGPDTIYAGSGRDLITGGSGNDLIVGGSGRETIDGGAGNNTIQVGTGPTLIQDNGVTGHDTVVGFDTAHGDKIGFEGENKASINNVVATANEHDGNTTITLPDGSTMTLVGISHIDHTFFH
jgi:Ca2+-binding RTX toxin-like protein